MQKFKVAIFGTIGSFHDLASHKFYGDDIKTLKCFTFRKCCEMLKNDEADYAVMAIENSLAGSILPNYNLIDEYKLCIIGEQYLKIELHLVALEGVKMKDIEFIHSHPMALAQCTNFLIKHPHIKIIEQGDTASCVKNIHDKNLRNVAAVANKVASKLYDVPVLVENIENNSENFTRFFLLSKENKKPENPNKASICFRVKHHTGSLADVLLVMKQHNVNLSKIQSVPVLGKRSEYSFHVDAEWSEYNEFKAAMKEIKDMTNSFSILGEYIKAKI